MRLNRNDRIVMLQPQLDGSLYRALVWCHLINEPGVVNFPGDVATCEVCKAALFEGDPSHEFIGTVTPPWVKYKLT